jgi:hypothetical protein
MPNVDFEFGTRIYRFFLDRLYFPVLFGVLAVLWKIGWKGWTDREDRMDKLEDRMQEISDRMDILEDAVNGGEGGDGIQAEVHEILNRLKDDGNS